ncbi:hypothetical protein ACFV29_19155 [Streptomyces sp. NPDC059690]|uniref:hypothetical protein n=1 Tax=Streptomyces sp. NPDC059690 TaxID=3346907 RepID=UPI003692FC06
MTTGCLVPEDEEQQTSYGTHRAEPHEDPPIYAALVREWWARDRMVPGVRDPQWMLLTAMSPTVTAQFPGPARAGRWERAAELPARQRTDKLASR